MGTNDDEKKKKEQRNMQTATQQSATDANDGQQQSIFDVAQETDTNQNTPSQRMEYTYTPTVSPQKAAAPSAANVETPIRQVPVSLNARGDQYDFDQTRRPTIDKYGNPATAYGRDDVPEHPSNGNNVAVQKANQQTSPTKEGADVKTFPSPEGYFIAVPYEEDGLYYSADDALKNYGEFYKTKFVGNNLHIAGDDGEYNQILTNNGLQITNWNPIAELDKKYNSVKFYDGDGNQTWYAYDPTSGDSKFVERSVDKNGYVKYFIPIGDDDRKLRKYEYELRKALIDNGAVKDDAEGTQAKRLNALNDESHTGGVRLAYTPKPAEPEKTAEPKPQPEPPAKSNAKPKEEEKEQPSAYEQLMAEAKKKHDEDDAALSKRSRANKAIYGIGDAARAVANLGFTTKYAPDVKQVSLTDKAQARYDKAKAQLDASYAQKVAYLDKLEAARRNGENMTLKQQIAAQNAENAIEKLRQAKEKSDRDAAYKDALLELKQQAQKAKEDYDAQRLSLQQYNATTARLRQQAARLRSVYGGGYGDWTETTEYNNIDPVSGKPAQVVRSKEYGAPKESTSKKQLPNGKKQLPQNK